MNLTLIVGPMKSGKSFELINYFAPLKYSDITYELYQSIENTRDEGIASRNGAYMPAQKIKSLKEIINTKASVVGIDEIHWFPPEEAAAIDSLLKKGVEIIAAGLALGYQGKMFEIIKNLIELGPKEIKYKQAICEICKKSATHHQLFNDQGPIIKYLPTSYLIDDGSCQYRAVCRDCFKK